jgi:predicted amidohydrolase YtcJ
MKKRVFLGVSLLVILILYVVFFHQRPGEATTLIVNGVVYTVSEGKPKAQAVAIRGNTIVGVGTNEEVRSSFKSPIVIDAGGRAVYPGFIDSHCHIERLGVLLKSLDLTGTTSIREILAAVADRATSTRNSEWIRGGGWDQSKWEKSAFPTRQMLDSVVKDIPVYLIRVDGHAVWVNTKVLEMSGVSERTPDPEGGRIIRNVLGEPTGVFVDKAVDLISNLLPTPSEGERTGAIERAIEECLKNGLTEVHDMGVDLDAIKIYEKLAVAKELPIRVYGAINGLGETWDYYLRTGPQIDMYGGRLTVRAIKLYADGALGSRGAALIEPYTDDPGSRGLTVISGETIKSTTAQALEEGFQVCTHAIGDRANHIVLNAYEEAYNSRKISTKDARLRVEHAQVIDSTDIPRFARLGVLPMMQPTHCTSDMYWAKERLGPRRILGAYAWRSLLEHGSIIPASSDFPSESPNSLLGFYAAITRQDPSGWPEGGWFPGQRMTREEALRSMTLWGAYAAFQESWLGSIEPNKRADIVILSHDIMEIAPREILTATVELCMIDGEISYSSGSVTSQKESK